MTKEQMINKVTRINGFENEWTVWFCELVEKEEFSESTLKDAMEFAISMAIAELEEE